MARRTTKGRWSYSAGERGRNRVRVYERENGKLYLAIGENGRVHRQSLHHVDHARAKRQADEIAAKLARDEAAVPSDISLSRLFEIFRSESKPPTKAVQTFRDGSARRLISLLGSDFKVRNLSRREYDLFVRERESGRLTGRPVGARTVARDLKFYRRAFRWAAQAGDRRGGTLLEADPWADFDLPTEKNPQQPNVSHEEYDAMLSVADEVSDMFRSFLVLAFETGRRVSAICGLRWNDIDWDEQRIRWRPENDKQRKEWIAPVSPEALEALRHQSTLWPERSGEDFVFPAPKDPSRPLRRDLVGKWWRRAEVLAGVERIPGRGIHSLRRRWASDMDDQPLHVTAEIGGWKDQRMVLRYQQSSESGRRHALANRKRTD